MNSNFTLKRKTKGVANSIDAHVGNRLRVRRSLLGLSQEKLAEAIGLTFQQVQKYERGMNRISAGKLYEFARILSVPVSYFFDQLPAGEGAGAITGFSDNPQQEFVGPDVMQNKETLELIRAYYAVHDHETRKNILKFIKSMGEKVSGS